MYKRGYCIKCKKIRVFNTDENYALCPLCNKYLQLADFNEDPKKLFAMAKKSEYLKVLPCNNLK